MVEIQKRLASELARARFRGELELTDEQAVLHIGEHQRAAPLEQLAEHWPHLDPKARSERIGQLQRQLAPTIPPRLPSAGQIWVSLGSVTLLTTVVAFLLLRGIWQNGESDSPEAEKSTRSETATARAQRVCEATRSRVMRGGSVGPTDTEGWLLELRLLRAADSPDLADTQGSEKFIHLSPTLPLTATLIWPDAPVALRGPGAGRMSITERRRADTLETTLELSGEYVRAYFDSDQRIHWIRFASAFATQLKASHGALYARCAHLDTHHIGGWFGAQTPGAAASALLYFMSAFVDSPQLTPEILGPKAPPAASREVLAALASHTENLKKSELALWLGADGGMLAGTDSGPSAITFPFKDSNRASRASLRLARRLKIAVAR